MIEIIFKSKIKNKIYFTRKLCNFYLRNVDSIRSSILKNIVLYKKMLKSDNFFLPKYFLSTNCGSVSSYFYQLRLRQNPDSGRSIGCTGEGKQSEGGRGLGAWPPPKFCSGYAPERHLKCLFFLLKTIFT